MLRDGQALRLVLSVALVAAGCSGFAVNSDAGSSGGLDGGSPDASDGGGDAGSIGMIGGCAGSQDGGMALTVDNFLCEFVQAECALEAQCQQVPDVAICVTDMSAPLSQGAFNTLWAAVAAVQAGRVQFDSTIASACLTRIASTTCDEFLSSAAPASDSCFAAFPAARCPTATPASSTPSACPAATVGCSSPRPAAASAPRFRRTTATLSRASPAPAARVASTPEARPASPSVAPMFRRPRAPARPAVDFNNAPTVWRATSARLRASA